MKSLFRHLRKKSQKSYPLSYNERPIRVRQPAAVITKLELAPKASPNHVHPANEQNSLLSGRTQPSTDPTFPSHPSLAANAINNQKQINKFQFKFARAVKKKC